MCEGRILKWSNIDSEDSDLLRLRHSSCYIVVFVIKEISFEYLKGEKYGS